MPDEKPVDAEETEYSIKLTAKEIREIHQALFNSMDLYLAQQRNLKGLPSHHGFDRAAQGHAFASRLQTKIENQRHHQDHEEHKRREAEKNA